MKRKNSLKKNEEIAKIVRSRISSRNYFYNIYYRKNDAGLSRICISVSKKLGDAVTRNKIKRQVREMVTDLFDFSLNFDYVIVVKDNFLNNSFIENKEKLSEAYNKIHKIKE